MVENRQAKWTIILSQYYYIIEYCKMTDHKNAGALNQFLVGEDPNFDGEE